MLEPLARSADQDLPVIPEARQDRQGKADKSWIPANPPEPISKSTLRHRTRRLSRAVAANRSWLLTQTKLQSLTLQNKKQAKLFAVEGRRYGTD